MVWGAFFDTTKTDLIFILPKSQKAADFIQHVYKPGLVPFLQKQDPDRSLNLVLMEDGAPVHKAKLSAVFLAQAKINKLPNWPPQSPDLNPIENVWKILKTNVQELYDPKSVSEMQEALKQAWNNFPNQTLINIIKSMPQQMQAVLDADGGPTRW